MDLSVWLESMCHFRVKWHIDFGSFDGLNGMKSTSMQEFQENDLKNMVLLGTLRRVKVIDQPAFGYLIVFEVGTGEVVLVNQHKKRRVFKNLETVKNYLANAFGVRKFEYEMQ